MPLRQENQALLRELGHVVWLKASINTIVDRCRPRIDKRPMLAGHEHDLEAHIKNLLELRIPSYDASAHSSIWTDDRVSAEQIALKIRRNLPRQKSGLHTQGVAPAPTHLPGELEGNEENVDTGAAN